MKREMEYLLSLLRAFLLEEEPQPAQEIDWEALENLASIHSVSGILGYMCMNYGLCPEERKAAMRQLCLQTMGLYARRGALAEAFCQGLEDQQIPYCTMKGFEIRKLYPVPELRSFNDVDILIRKEDRKTCHTWMLSQGFEAKDDWEPVFSYTKGQEYYEIHSQLMEVDVTPQADYQGYFGQAWEQTQTVSQYGHRMEREFHLLYLITHIAKHVQGSGAGVRMYLDITACVKAWGESLDWESCFRELEELKLKEFGCAVLTAAESWFGVACPAEFSRLDDDTLARFAQFTLEAGTFGHHGRSSAVSSLKKQEESSRLTVLRKRLFPSAKSIERRYTYLQNRPYLLPVAWVHRLFKTDVSLSKHAKEAKGILTADRQEIDRLQAICKEIGL